MQKEKFEVTLLIILLFSTITNGKLLPFKSLNKQEIQLVRCLTYNSHRYFAPGRSLVMSSPATYRDLQQELIAVIQLTAIWPVVVTVDGNISKTDKTDFIDRDGSYIILIPDGDIRSFKAENNGQPGGREKSTRSWNSKAVFFTGENKFSKISQHRNHLIVCKDLYYITESS
jgi:hypothetical protein